ncbi:uncharacterized protein EV422DRAFT_58591 [Fimicolochytrium jonesii]|uniref:uncharacterized protein n=1 Tax=Fimicolochytrium jonesii TaxID=1396493 RepID=UPI0022FF3785|nr:uncharacterized protein EV422DRAFT_58591 [Fimicolochytrium jonesii]KAI8820662.1 hypothetical protein EV422DRAFT_58591 [Fimicolochytrium jonesii]
MKMQRPRTVPSLAADFLHSRTEVENMVMNYFYLYLDLMEGHEELELDRHQLARLTKLDTEGGEVVDASALCRDRFPRLQEMCDRGIPTNSFMWVKVPLDLNLLLPGEFHNVSVLETNRPRTIECTTTVYHFGQRILETKEIQCPTAHGPPSSHHIKDSFNDAHTQPYHHAYATRSSSRRGSYQSACLSGAGSEDRTNNIGTLPLNKRNLYHFDFVKRFFSTFLAGLHCFEMEVEKRIAVDNLSVMQVFEDISPAFDLPHSQNPPLLCVCYQFECGKGDAKSHFIKNR